MSPGATISNKDRRFNRLDTKLAKDSRVEIYPFLAQYLNPPNPVK